MSYHSALGFLINYLFIDGVLTAMGQTSLYVKILLSVSAMFGLIALSVYFFPDSS